MVALVALSSGEVVYHVVRLCTQTQKLRWPSNANQKAIRSSEKWSTCAWEFVELSLDILRDNMDIRLRLSGYEVN